MDQIDETDEVTDLFIIRIRLEAALSGLWVLIRARDRLERERRGGVHCGRGGEGVAPFDHQSGGGVGEGQFEKPLMLIVGGGLDPHGD